MIFKKNIKCFKNLTAFFTVLILLSGLMFSQNVLALTSGDTSGTTSVNGGGNGGENSTDPMAGKKPLNYVGAYLTTITGSNSTTGDSIDNGKNVPVKPTIKIVFDKNIVSDLVWDKNKACFTLQDSSGKTISINVSRIPDNENFEERNNVFITPVNDLTPGESYKIRVSAELLGKNLYSTLGGTTDNKGVVITFSTIMEKSVTSANVKRLSGRDRIETSIAIAKEEFKDKAPDAIVLTTANGFPDALSGEGLAYKYNAPMLLVNKSVNDSKNVLDYITSTLSKGKNIYILGGTGVVSTDISDYLTSQGYNIIRIGGSDRYETNQKVVKNLNVTKGTSIVLASGNDFADALSVSSIAALKGYPVLLSGKDNLSTNVINDITNIQPTNVYIIGGTGALSANIEAQIKNINGSVNIVRLGGKDRYETSIKIVDYFNLDTDIITVASGRNFPDALSGSVLAAKKNSGILLIDNTDITRQKDLLSKHGIKSVIILGGEGVISGNTVNSLIQK